MWPTTFFFIVNIVYSSAVRPEPCNSATEASSSSSLTECGPDELYSDCANEECQVWCQGQQTSLKVCDLQQCRPGCVCRYGLVRNRQGICIKPLDCGKCFGNNEEFLCGPKMDRTCERLFEKRESNYTNCCYGCYCKTGFARNHNYDCIPIRSCPGVRIRRNTEFKDCGRIVTCLEQFDEIVVNSSSCQPGIYCSDGYFLDHKNRCVEPRQCRCEDPHAALVEYPNPCPGGTCSQPEFQECSLRPKRAGCQCKRGFLLDVNGRCIRATKCKNPTITSPGGLQNNLPRQPNLYSVKPNTDGLGSYGNISPDGLQNNFHGPVFPPILESKLKYLDEDNTLESTNKKEGENDGIAKNNSSASITILYFDDHDQDVSSDEDHKRRHKDSRESHENESVEVKRKDRVHFYSKADKNSRYLKYNSRHSSILKDESNELDNDEADNYESRHNKHGDQHQQTRIYKNRRIVTGDQKSESCIKIKKSHSRDKLDHDEDISHMDVEIHKREKHHKRHHLHHKHQSHHGSSSEEDHHSREGNIIIVGNIQPVTVSYPGTASTAASNNQTCSEPDEDSRFTTTQQPDCNQYKPSRLYISSNQKLELKDKREKNISKPVQISEPKEKKEKPKPIQIEDPKSDIEETCMENPVREMKILKPVQIGRPKEEKEKPKPIQIENPKSDIEEACMENPIREKKIPKPVQIGRPKEEKEKPKPIQIENPKSDIEEACILVPVREKISKPVQTTPVQISESEEEKENPKPIQIENPQIDEPKDEKKNLKPIRNENPKSNTEVAHKENVVRAKEISRPIQIIEPSNDDKGGRKEKPVKEKEVSRPIEIRKHKNDKEGDRKVIPRENENPKPIGNRVHKNDNEGGRKKNLVREKENFKPIENTVHKNDNVGGRKENQEREKETSRPKQNQLKKERFLNDDDDDKSSSSSKRLRSNHKSIKIQEENNDENLGDSPIQTMDFNYLDKNETNNQTEEKTETKHYTNILIKEDEKNSDRVKSNKPSPDIIGKEENSTKVESHHSTNQNTTITEDEDDEEDGGDTGDQERKKKKRIIHTVHTKRTIRTRKVRPMIRQTVVHKTRTHVRHNATITVKKSHSNNRHKKLRYANSNRSHHSNRSNSSIIVESSHGRRGKGHGRTNRKNSQDSGENSYHTHRNVTYTSTKRSHRIGNNELEQRGRKNNNSEHSLRKNVKTLKTQQSGSGENSHQSHHRSNSSVIVEISHGRHGKGRGKTGRKNSQESGETSYHTHKNVTCTSTKRSRRIGSNKNSSEHSWGGKMKASEEHSHQSQHRSNSSVIVESSHGGHVKGRGSKGRKNGHTSSGTSYHTHRNVTYTSTKRSHRIGNEINSSERKDKKASKTQQSSEYGHKHRGCGKSNGGEETSNGSHENGHNNNKIEKHTSVRVVEASHSASLKKHGQQNKIDLNAKSNSHRNEGQASKRRNQSIVRKTEEQSCSSSSTSKKSRRGNKNATKGHRSGSKTVNNDHNSETKGGNDSTAEEHSYSETKSKDGDGKDEVNETVETVHEYSVIEE